MKGERIIDKDFFTASADKLAVKLLGKTLVRKIDDIEYRYIIAETECYMGVEDTACHAARKRPVSARALWNRGGTLYVYLTYGMHYMLNIVAGVEGDPMGVLIRGLKGIIGPGRLTKELKITKDFDHEDLLTSERIWLEDTGINPKYKTSPRVGIDYAEEKDRNIHWRFLAYDYI